MTKSWKKKDEIDLNNMPYPNLYFYIEKPKIKTEKKIYEKSKNE